MSRQMMLVCVVTSLQIIIWLFVAVWYHAGFQHG